MLDPRRPVYAPILLPGDREALAAADRLAAAIVSATYGQNPRLRELAALARRKAAVLLVDPRTAHFQYEGYLSMPEYRSLPYSPSRGVGVALWEADRFDRVERRRALIERVFATQRELGADLLLAPYFVTGDPRGRWLRRALETAAEAVAAGRPRRVGVPVWVELDAILDAPDRRRIAAAYRELGADLYWVTVVNYDELEAGPAEVRAVVELVELLAADRRPVLLGYVGRTGLLAVARGAAGYAAGTYGLESHPRRHFREMMGTAPANTYYLHECMVRLPAAKAEALLACGVDWERYPCACPACAGSARITGMVSRRLIAHALRCRRQEVEELAAVPEEQRLARLRHRLAAALERCRAAAAALASRPPGRRLERGEFHYLEVLLEAAGGPRASIPRVDDERF